MVNAMVLGTITALQKDNGKIRGIVAGDVLRRSVARTLAQQHAEAFGAACMPFQFALPTRAGTDCVARVVRALSELNPESTVVSVDGIGAFDHVRTRNAHGGRQPANASSLRPSILKATIALHLARRRRRPTRHRAGRGRRTG